MTAGQTYRAFINGPYKCWKGDISIWPGFWTKVGYTQQCCGLNVTAKAYAASGITIQTVASQSPPSSSTTTTKTTSLGISFYSNNFKYLIMSFHLFLVYSILL